MSRIQNEARIKFSLIRAVRGQLEQRAQWLYLLTDEARKHGLPAQTFAPAAITRCGLFQGAGLVQKGGTRSLRGLKKTLFTRGARWIFEMDVVESTDDRLSLDFHYCPLVEGWKKMGCTDEQIAELCDIAMCGDHAIGAQYNAVLDLPQCIAKGDPICALRYRKKEE